ncbi:prolyl oligopeptidase family serine peptidase [Streptomonospora sp. S1-112]|uniref:Prolyl oligopeptidase family serine peptidase n=1 Tax=Streptomonospora mangrovi TaxID=2883123 RepID=A0A9X3NG37_9ACTN|nr:prolyl oligopeptidase family serine peptidase [Streptomonospora mangrovi]MDA0563029.1 prolyl oligopeptidase family serine peptidase [Streptomonospora mangrovi]
MSFPRQQARTRRFTIGVPRAFQISPDGRRVAFLRGRDGDDGLACLWVHDLDTGRERVVADPRAVGGAAEEDLPPEERARRERLRETGGGIVSYTVDRGFTRAAFTLSGRLYAADLAGDGGVRELPAAAPVVDPALSPTGAAVAYVSGGALRVVDVEGGRDRALAEPDAPGVTWGLAEFIAAEEMGRFRGLWWAPDGSAVLAARVDESPVTRWTISDPANPGAAAQTIAYPPPGTANADVRLAVLDVLDVADVGDSGGAAPEPRWVEWDREALPYLVTAGWAAAADGAPEVAFTVQSRDQRTLRLLRADAATGAVREVRAETDPVWVEIMPGVPAHTEDGETVWIGLCAEGAGGGVRRAVFVGDREFGPREDSLRAVLDVDGGHVLYSASPAGRPGETGLWLLDTRTGAARRVSVPGAGDSPGMESGRLRGGTLVLQRRDMDTDGVRTLLLADAASEAPRPAGEIRSLAHAPDLPRPRPAFWSAGERRIPAALLLPSWYEPDPAAPLPVLMDPYGGPHAQRVVRARAAYLTSQWFAEQGFAVLVADGRGTPGVGVAWEQAVHGDLANPVLEDQVAALHDAAERFGCLDLSRVAVRGWSFGGYLAALAVLRRPDVFHAAVAGAPVTLWELYDTHYTERYLGTPEERPAAYARSSVLEGWAEPHRPLMLIHGLADDNVVFAHSQRLSTALLAAGRAHTVLPLSGITHMPSEETTAENMLLLQVEFLRTALGLPAKPEAAR